MAIIDELISRLGFELDGKEDLREFKRGMNDAEKGAKGFATSVTQMARNVTLGIGASIAAVKGLTVGMFALADAAARPLDDLVNLSARTGESVEAIQEWSFAAQQSGSSAAEMQASIETMNRRIAQAARGTGAAKNALDDFGISATDAEGNIRRATDVMGELAGRFDDLDQGQRLDIARALGISMSMVNVLSQGNDELERLRQVARDAGLVFTREDTEAAAAYVGAMDMLMISVRGLRDRIAIDMLPTLMQMVGGMQEWFNANREVIQQNVGAALERIARHARTLSENGSDMIESLRGWEPLFLGLARVLFPTAFAIGLLVLALDEILTWWSGDGESFMGAFSDWLQSIGASEGVADTLTAIAVALGLFAALKPRAFGKFVAILWRLSGAAALMKALGVGAVFTAAGTGLTTLAGVSFGKLFLIAAAVWAVYEAAKALSGISFGDNVREFLKDLAPPQTKEEQDEVISKGPIGFLGDAVGDFLARGPLSRLLTEGLAIAPPSTDGESQQQQRPLSPFDARPEYQPQSLGTQSPDSFSDRFGTGPMAGDVDQSTHVEVGGITVTVPPGADGRAIGQEAADALRRALSIHGASPVTP